MGKMKKRKRGKSPDEKRSRKTSNPLLEEQRQFLGRLLPTERDAFFSPLVSPSRRASVWMDQANLGERLIDQYSWATPDDRAIRILKNFSPLIEIGCGSNAYWCSIMQRPGIDIVGYDIKPETGGLLSHPSGVSPAIGRFPVRKGGPNVLENDDNRNRTLFLCYADDDINENSPLLSDGSPMSLGSACLRHYRGQYVVHVGETFLDSCLAMDQAPWGRSSSPEFQQQLAAEFHCVLHVTLPSWLHVRDSLTVWKRSETCTIVFAAEGDDDQDEEIEYRHIPKDEILPVDRAAPYLAHLLKSDHHSSSSEQMKAPMNSPAEERKVGSANDPKAAKLQVVERVELNSQNDYETPW